MAESGAVRDALLKAYSTASTAFNTITIPSTDSFQFNENVLTGNSELIVSNKGHESTANSYMSNLAAGAVFTGAWEDTLDYGTVAVSIKSDQDSAADGLDVQWSVDGVTETQDDVFTYSKNGGKIYTFTPANRYFRVVYTNSTNGTADIDIQTILRKSYIKDSSHRIQDSIVSEDDASLVKAVLTGQDSTGAFQNVATTIDGNLTISDNSNGLSIAQGNVSGVTFIHKFGTAPDWDDGDGTVTIWDGANDTTIAQYVYQYSTSANITQISSTDAADTMNVEIQGLNSTYGLTTLTTSLNGQTPVTMSTSFLRVFRMKNIGSTDIAGNVYATTSTATFTNGLPDASSDVRAMITNGNNQTLMAVYTIPAGKTGYMRDWYASSAGANRNTNYVIDLFARKDGEVFQLKHKSAISDNANSYLQHKYEEPEIFTEKTDIELRATITDSPITAASVSGGFDIVLVDN